VIQNYSFEDFFFPFNKQLQQCKRVIDTDNILKVAEESPFGGDKLSYFDMLNNLI